MRTSVRSKRVHCCHSKPIRRLFCLSCATGVLNHHEQHQHSHTPLYRPAHSRLLRWLPHEPITRDLHTWMQYQNVVRQKERKIFVHSAQAYGIRVASTRNRLVYIHCLSAAHWPGSVKSVLRRDEQNQLVNKRKKCWSACSAEWIFCGVSSKKRNPTKINKWLFHGI